MQKRHFLMSRRGTFLAVAVGLASGPGGASARAASGSVDEAVVRPSSAKWVSRALAEELMACWARGVDALGQGRSERARIRLTTCVASDATFQIVLDPSEGAIEVRGLENIIHFVDAGFREAGYVRTQHRVTNISMSRGSRGLWVDSYMDATHNFADGGADVRGASYRVRIARRRGTPQIEAFDIVATTAARTPSLRESIESTVNCWPRALDTFAARTGAGGGGYDLPAAREILEDCMQDDIRSEVFFLGSATPVVTVGKEALLNFVAEQVYTPSGYVSAQHLTGTPRVEMLDPTTARLTSYVRALFYVDADGDGRVDADVDLVGGQYTFELSRRSGRWRIRGLSARALQFAQVPAFLPLEPRNSPDP